MQSNWDSTPHLCLKCKISFTQNACIPAFCVRLAADAGQYGKACRQKRYDLPYTSSVCTLFRYLIVFSNRSAQQGRIGIPEFSVFLHPSSAVVGIAVQTAAGAGMVGSYICALHAETFPSLAFCFSRLHTSPCCPFQKLPADAAALLYSKPGQITGLRAGADLHSMFCGNFR